MGEHRICTDPMERMVQEALESAGIRYVLEGECPSAGQTLDFWLVDYGVYIECKQFHSPRMADQMSRAPNIIALQGAPAVKLFCARLSPTGDPAS